MKAIKKLMAALLAVAMLCAMAVPAFAADQTGKITVKNTVKGQTYTLYQILAIDSHNDDYSALNYKAITEWKEFVENGAGNEYLDTDAQGYVTWKASDNAETVAAFAAVAKEAATGKTKAGEAVANGSEVIFDNLPLGYYLVVSDLGVLCSLNTTKPDVEIYEKNGAPSVDKEVEGANGYNKGNDAGVGDTVNYKVTVNVTDGNPKNYVLHDTMSGLTFNEDSVQIKKADDTEFTGYTVVTKPTDGCTFEIVFNEGSLKTNDVLTITYSATVSESAVIGDAGNPNDIVLKYGDDNQTAHSDTKTYVWSFDVFKYTTEDNGTEKALKGAEFILYKGEGENKQYAKFNANGVLTGWTASESDATVLTSPEDGKIAIKGLDAGTYYLKETKAPDGYNALAEDITVVIEANNTSNTSASAKVLNGSAVTDGTIKVLNKTGKVLPSTGGMGTTLFYVIGGGLMIAAVVLLVTKKRMEKN